MTPKPTLRVEVRYQRVQDLAFGLLIVVLGGPAAIALLSSHGSSRGLLVAGIALALLLTVYALRTRAKRRSVRRFDETGITQRNGRHTDWQDFRGAITRTHRRVPSGPPLIWRVELVFADGDSAWVIPQQVSNRAEVFGYLATLPTALELSADSKPR